ncbi:MAG: OmpA family protein [Bacteroidales bacterium]|nr:OmpA family protein [Bacteroidales bacterium]
MKKFLVVLASLLTLASTAKAQDTFYPAWYWGIKAGASYTSGEATKWTDLLTGPTIGINAGYQFFPCFSVRGELSGFQAKGTAIFEAVEKTYKFNYAQLTVDAVLDICNIFKFKAARVVNPYIFLGIGGNLRFNNKECPKDMLPVENYYWTKATPSFMGRFGGGIDFRVSPSVVLALEFQENILTDKFNSKVGNALGSLECDQNLSLLAGVKFTFGAAKAAKAAELAAAEAAAAAAAAAAAEKAAAEKAAREAAEKAAAEKAAREAAERAAAEKAAREAAERQARLNALAGALDDETRSIYFLIGKSVIRKSESAKIDKIADAIKNLDCNVVVKGYADKATGTPAINLKLSEKRVNAVKAALEKKGIDASRISTEFYGDTQQVSETPAKNRVAISILTD